MTTYRLTVREKGRTVLPADLQRACGFGVGSELVARRLGPGRFVVETVDAVLERIWSGIPEATAESGVDVLHAWRATSDAARDDRLRSAVLPDEETSRARAECLLDDRGL